LPNTSKTTEATVHRNAAFLLLVVTAALPAAAEEISLRDGTKIVGHMTAVTPDKIEVETSYGKVQLKRGEILTISFPENGVAVAGAFDATPAPAPAKSEAPKMDEALNGIQYVNRTAKFASQFLPIG
jgi:hypothetical protein